MITVIGDSHARFFGHLELSILYTDAGPTAKGSNYNSKVNEWIIARADNYIIFSFGEIDIRSHISKACILNSILDEEKMKVEVNSVISEYMKLIDKAVELTHNKVIIYLPIASGLNLRTDINAYPWYGTNIQRNIITQNFNNKLIQLLNSKSIRYISLFEDMIDENLNTKDECLIDESTNNTNKVHLSNVMIEPLKNKLQKIGIII